jgi:hypothetical protein
MEPEISADIATEVPKKKSRKRLWFYLFFALPVIVLLAAMAIPNHVKARMTECKNACINNLRQLDGAKEQWALENKKPAGTIVTAADEAAILKFVKGEAMPKCPDGGTLRINNIDAVPTCSFAGHSL